MSVCAANGQSPVFELNAFFRGRYSYLYVEGSGAYGWFWNGDLDYQSVAGVIFGPSGGRASFNLGTAGSVQSAKGIAGAFFPLQKQSWQCVLIPVGGYGYEGQIIRRKAASPNTKDTENLSDQTVSLNLTSKKYNQKWYGPLAGGIFTCRPITSFRFDLGYHYNWLHLNKTSALDITFTRLAGGVPDIIQQLVVNLKTRTNRAYGHSAMANLCYYLTNHLLLSAKGNYNYYHAKKTRLKGAFGLDIPLAPAFISGQIENVINLLDKVHWSSFSVLLDASYEF